MLNPLLVEGQMHGGIAQGFGQAIKEVVVHDAGGELLTGSFSDYAMPLACDLPNFRLANREVPTSVNPLGAKGVGEAGDGRIAGGGHERRLRRARRARYRAHRHAGHARARLVGDPGCERERCMSGPLRSPVIDTHTHFVPPRAVGLAMAGGSWHGIQFGMSARQDHLFGRVAFDGNPLADADRELRAASPIHG